MERVQPEAETSEHVEAKNGFVLKWFIDKLQGSLWKLSMDGRIIDKISCSPPSIIADTIIHYSLRENYQAAIREI